METPDFGQLKQAYSQSSDEDLLRLSLDRKSLTASAQEALRLEFLSRGLNWEHHSPDLSQTSPPSTTKKANMFGWLWPVITNEMEAKRAAKNGAYGAAFIAVVTCVLSLIGIATREPFLGLDGWAMIDALLFAVVAWRIFKYSFPWSVFGLSLYFAEIFWRWSREGPKGSPIVTCLIVLSLIAGVRGTAFLNKMRTI